MRKSALSIKSDKVYNPNNLELTGNRILLLSPEKPKAKYQPSKAVSRRALKIDSVEQQQVASHIVHKSCQPREKPPKAPTCKNSLKTSVTEYTNSEVSNKLLKQIKETSAVKDFEKILQSLWQSEQFLSSKTLLKRNKRDKILERLDEDDLYEEFFGKYFDYLSNVVNQSRCEEPQH